MTSKEQQKQRMVTVFRELRQAQNMERVLAPLTHQRLLLVRPETSAKATHRHSNVGSVDPSSLTGYTACVNISLKLERFSVSLFPPDVTLPYPTLPHPLTIPLSPSALSSPCTYLSDYIEFPFWQPRVFG